MTKAMLKPIMSNLRQRLLKGLAHKMEKMGFSQSGFLVFDRALSPMEYKLRSQLVTLFRDLKIAGQEEAYLSYLEESARTWMHVLVFFKTLEKRAMAVKLTSESVQESIFDARLFPDFSHFYPESYQKYLQEHKSEIEKAMAQDCHQQAEEYYAFGGYLSALCRKLDEEIPILFGDEAHRLLLPDFASMKEILSALEQIPEEEYRQDDFLGWIYQYWVDTTAMELAAAGAECKNSYAGETYEKILRKLSRDQTEAGEYYTPRWVVQFIVEKSIETYSQKKRKLESVRLIDPACGAGNFLVYAFDVFYQYYRREHPDWPVSQTIRRILEQNIFGCEIKRESLQIAAVNLWLKAQQTAMDSGVSRFRVHKMNLLLANSLERWERTDHNKGENLSIFDLLEPGPKRDWFADGFHDTEAARMFFQRKFQIVVMNPPFVDARKMDPATSQFLKREYGENARNLLGAFIERVFEITEKGSVIGFISSDTFFYLSSFSKLRRDILSQAAIQVLLTLGRGVFEGPAVDAAVSIYEAGQEPDGKLLGANLAKALLSVPKNRQAISAALAESRQYLVEQSEFWNVPSYPFLYDLSPQMREIFSRYPCLGTPGRHYVQIRQGMATGNNEKYLYKKWEIPEDMLGKQFYPYAKGGGYCKYQNDISDYIDWREEARVYYNTSKKARKNYLSSYFSEGDTSLFLKEAITYSDITSENRFSARLLPAGCVFDIKGSCLFPQNIDSLYLLGFLNSRFANYILKKLNPSPSFQVGDLMRLPYCQPDETTSAHVCRNVQALIELQEFMLGFRYTSDFYRQTEIAYGFQMGASTLEAAYSLYRKSMEQAQEQKVKLQDEIDQLIYRLYELTAADIETIELEFPELPQKQSSESIKKKAVLSYLRAIMKDHFHSHPPRLYRDQEAAAVIREHFVQTFGPVRGKQILEEAEAVLGRTILAAVRQGVAVGNAAVPFAGNGSRDREEPILQQKVLGGTGEGKYVVIWDNRQFRIALDQKKAEIMQSEIHRLCRGYYMPQLQCTQGALQGGTGASRKWLMQEEKVLNACVNALETWKPLQHEKKN